MTSPRRYPSNHIHLARQLRRDQTDLEAALWEFLANRKLGGFKFRRQQVIGSFIADFYCSECQLIIELDGDSHLDKEEYDQERTEWLEQKGYHVLRIRNEDLREDVDEVLSRILKACEQGKDDLRS